MNYCQVCGYELHEPMKNSDICPCCGVMWGYEDNNERSLLNYRSLWINGGCKWFDEELRPTNWKAKIQLLRVGVQIDFE